MHPRIAELIAYIDSELENLRDAYESVPADRRASRPSPGPWSPPENIHHLEIVERRLADRLAALIEQARSLPPETDTASLFPNVNADRVVNRTSRFKTSEAAEPRGTDVSLAW